MSIDNLETRVAQSEQLDALVLAEIRRINRAAFPSSRNGDAEDLITYAKEIVRLRASTAPPLSEPLVERVTNAILFAARDDGYDSPVDYGDAEGLARAALAALPAPADDVVERVNEHLRAARHVMYDEHWLAQAIDKFLSEDAALAKQGG